MISKYLPENSDASPVKYEEFIEMKDSGRYDLYTRQGFFRKLGSRTVYWELELDRVEVEKADDFNKFPSDKFRLVLKSNSDSLQSYQGTELGDLITPKAIVAELHTLKLHRLDIAATVSTKPNARRGGLSSHAP